MFTGLVQRVGRLRRLSQRDGGACIDIAVAPWDEPWQLGESLAVQGACLTLTAADARGVSGDVLQETLDCTVLGRLRPGDLVNLERALRLGDRLGGHLVTGHIDGVGTVESLRETGRDRVLRIRCDPRIVRRMVYKGSIAVDGISLTVSDLCDPQAFEVYVIPTTWNETSLAQRRSGDRVNLETDLLGKHVERLLTVPSEAAPPITLATLEAAGFSG